MKSITSNLTNNVDQLKNTSSRVIFSLLCSVFFVSCSLFLTNPVHATYRSDPLPNKTVYNDFVVGPGKFELNMKPGDTRTVNIIVSNRLGSDKSFQIQLEDFTGTRDPATTVVLLDTERGPYSLKDYLDIPEMIFDVNHATRVTVPVTVRIPEDAQPGGLYGSVVISTVTRPGSVTPEGELSAGTNPIITRIGTLFFIRVAGDVVEDGAMSSFALKNNKKFVGGDKPIDFRILYENNGSIHLNPYGLITVRNLIGANVSVIEVEPWFAMPDSLRLREVSWTPPFLFGRYTATAEINRGYDDIIDTISLTFWVIPWKIILAVFISLILIVVFFKWLFSKFSIVKKSKK